MGMYTQLVMGAQLKKSTPETALEALRCMVDARQIQPTTLPAHPLFATPRWSLVLNCDSAYFDWESDSEFIQNLYGSGYYLRVISNVKNYDNEIQLFLEWIAPYLDTQGFLGFTRYEEDDHPTLIYNNGGKITSSSPSPTPTAPTPSAGLEGRRSGP